MQKQKKELETVGPDDWICLITFHQSKIYNLTTESIS